MPKAFPLIVVILLWVNIADGRIFESELSLSQRFGPPKSRAVSGKFGSRELQYSKDGWNIRAWFIQDRCHVVSYSFFGLATPTSPQIDAIFQANSDGQSWNRKKGDIAATHFLFPNHAHYHFIRKDERVHAQKSPTGITFKSDYWMEAELAEKKARETKQTAIPNF